jgi:prophage tail gpP-like protein
VSITRQWPGSDGVPQIQNGDRVEVMIGDDLVITGWVEALPLRYDATAITMGSLAAAKRQTLLTARGASAAQR